MFTNEQLPKNLSPNIIEESLNLAVNSRNSLLLNYIRIWTQLRGGNFDISREADLDEGLKWFDTLPVDDDGLGENLELVEKKIAKTVNAINNLGDKGLFICVVAPALDEVANIAPANQIQLF